MITLDPPATHSICSSIQYKLACRDSRYYSTPFDIQELKLSLSDMEARLKDIKDNILFIDDKKTRLNEIDNNLSKEEVWSDLALSQKLSKEKTTLEKSIKMFDDVSRKLSDSVVLLEVSIEENDDSSINIDRIIMYRISNKMHISKKYRMSIVSFV